MLLSCFQCIFYKKTQKLVLIGGNNPINMHLFVFVQMLWKNSTYIGCSTTANKKCLLVLVLCLYKPKGNVQGHALMSDWNFEAIRSWGENISTCNG